MDVIVIGAGPVGMATATCLGQQGMSVGVVEKNPAHAPPTQSARWYAMGDDTLSWLRGMDVLVTGHDIDKVTVTCAGSPEQVVFGGHKDDTVSTVVGCGVLRSSLQERMQSLDTVSLYPACRVTSWNQKGGRWHLDLSHGKTLCAPLVIGCDGRASSVGSFFQPKTSTWDFGQKACVFLVQGMERGKGYEHFFPGGSLALLSIDDGPESGQKGSGVGIWADDVSRCSGPHVMASIQQAVQALVPGVQVVPDSGQWFPLHGKWVHNPFLDRCALIGDAACAIHPLAGQGLNIGLRMSKRLCDHVVQRYRTACDWGQALDTLFWPFYAVAGVMQAATYGLAQGLSVHARPQIWTWGAHLVNAVPALKQIILGASGKK